MSMVWTKHETGFYYSDRGFQIHFAAATSATAPQFKLQCCILVDPDGAACCIRDTVKHCQNEAEIINQ